MQLKPGIITQNLEESKMFYTEVLNFSVVYEADFFILMSTPNGRSEISFLMPNHPSQDPIFHPAYDGKGIYLNIEVDDVDAYYHELKQKGVEIYLDIRDEPWGERHFVIMDTNNVPIDFTTYTAAE
ncbi:Glyoxalase/Bleomycin resistance protein/Dioxygenase superfamily protein [Cruoricaptor ignavus]|uniref:Glyoxalase/Bleomycin resistance protein/Dioxygenase superfamily protein n=1 Tax=Cruoricaptor ignavus TaxID=1118202 RepID=A0A1M6A127_9FLAO|nr:VOC family protein [Cruoricaptor ignavus]SHI30165.1 Glyoxalase/Bleomycin resistance protein/Dioxygenase superfamily protein [Cruoricaptor ignavus]